MCLFDKPSPPSPPSTPVQPTKKEVISTEDTTAQTAAAQKRRKGYSSTIATSGSGLVDTATIKKVTLGS